MRFFTDSSVIFTMVDSPTGAARELLRFALQQKVTLVVSEYVFEEVEKRLQQKRPHAMPLFIQVKILDFWELVTITDTQIQEAETHVIDPEDAPILAAAKLAQVDALVSFDRKHLHKKSVEAYINAPVMIAGDALQLIRSNH